MPKVFDQSVSMRRYRVENIAIMRDAYHLALQELRLKGGSDEERLALVEILKHLANVEPFNNPQHMATLAVEWYRSRA